MDKQELKPCRCGHTPLVDKDSSLIPSNRKFSAPLPCELLEVLPNEVDTNTINFYRTDNNNWCAEYSTCSGFLGECDFCELFCDYDKSLANCLAKLLLKLIEEKLVEV